MKKKNDTYPRIRYLVCSSRWGMTWCSCRLGEPGKVRGGRAGTQEQPPLCSAFLVQVEGFGKSNSLVYVIIDLVFPLNHYDGRLSPIMTTLGKTAHSSFRGCHHGIAGQWYPSARSQHWIAALGTSRYFSSGFLAK